MEQTSSLKCDKPEPALDGLPAAGRPVTLPGTRRLYTPLLPTSDTRHGRRLARLAALDPGPHQGTPGRGERGDAGEFVPAGGLEHDEGRRYAR